MLLRYGAYACHTCERTHHAIWYFIILFIILLIITIIVLLIITIIVLLIITIIILLLDGLI